MLLFQTIADYEHAKILGKLTSTITPSNDENLWFSTFACPQVVADVYNRHVIVFIYRQYQVEKERRVNKCRETMSFFPLVEMNILENSNNPILLLPAHSHFYLLELKEHLKVI